MALLGMGNPLLDISVTVDAAFLKKYDLEPANAILAEEKHQPLYPECIAMPGVEYIAGGATQNSIRVAQWMKKTCGIEGSSSYMGCVGADDTAKTMRECCAKDGIDARYMEDASTPTGTCAVLVVDNDRSLVANLAAANNYKVDHTSQDDHWAVVAGAKVIYSAGFFMTVSPEAIEKVSTHAAANGITYCFNLSAPFLMEVPPFKAVLTATMPRIDFLFGNETECATFAKTEGWEETKLEDIAAKISLLPKEGKPRTVVITQGCDPTIVAVEGKTTTYPVLKLEKAQLVDTNGAGDAYVGGFLAGLCGGKEIAECCKMGAYAASEIVQVAGCAIPAAPKSQFA